MYKFNSKEDIETLIQELTDIAKEHNLGLSDDACELIRIISLFLLYDCNEGNHTAIAIMKCLMWCKRDDNSQTTFETMIKLPGVNKEPCKRYKKLLAKFGGRCSKEFSQTIFECQAAICFYVGHGENEQIRG